MSKKILATSTRGLRGVGQNVIEHFGHLTEQDNIVDYLTTDKTDTIKKFLSENYNIKINEVINNFSGIFYDKYMKTGDWFKFYDEINVESIKDYDYFFINGGVNFPQMGITRNGKKQGIFPENATTTFMSVASKIINLLAMLKAHHLYGIPIHELAYDPTELNMNLYHPSIKTNINNNYYLYHSYEVPEYGMDRLDSSQYFYKYIQPAPKYDKIYDLTFGYTYIKKERLNYIEEFNEFSSKIQNKQIFVKDIQSKTNNFLKRKEYLEYIGKSRFTYIIPAWWDRFFSGYRLIESLAHDCLPIINIHCRTDEINKSFGINLDELKLDYLPYEEFRLEKLEYLKNKIF